MPADPVFEELEALLSSQGSAAALDYLDHRFREEKNYRALFDARLMRARLGLGLSLLPGGDIPSAAQSAYNQAVTEAARETAELFLSEGRLAEAWPYLRAIGDTARMAAAIETAEPGEDADPLIEIAFQEGVHPLKGLELILAKYGTCRAISAFAMSAVEKDREPCIALLVRDVHYEIVRRLSDTIEHEEGARPASDSIADLAAGREWLFGEYSSYVDTSHLVSVLQYTPEVSEPSTLRLLSALCGYGKRLSRQFATRGTPPFEDVYEDYGHYAQALLESDPEPHLEHFRRKVADSDPQQVGNLPAQALTRLLWRLGRNSEALDVALAHFPDATSAELNCPSAMDLCQFARDFDRLQALARERGDLLTFAAACGQKLQTTQRPTSSRD